MKKINIEPGQRFTSKDGHIATVVSLEYYTTPSVKNCYEITVEWDDGKHQILKYHNARELARGDYNRPEDLKTKHIGESKMMKCGLKATIIAYRRYADIDVEFENGFIKRHTFYEDFKKGTLTTRFQRYTNEELKTAANSLGMSLSGFKNRIYVSSLTLEEAIAQGSPKPAIDHKGEIFSFSDGTKCEVIETIGKGLVTVKFDNGEIISNIRYDILKSGYKPGGRLEKSNVIGQTYMTHCGLRVTIVQYTRNNKIKVRFEDGIYLDNVSMSSLRKGTVSHPFLSSKSNCEYMGYKVFAPKKYDKRMDRFITRS